MNMMRFIAGLTKFNGIRTEAVKQVVLVKKAWIKETWCLDSYSVELLYECQNVSVLDKEDTYTPDWRYSLPAHLWLVLGYCIANSQCAWNLNFYSMNVNAEMLLQGLQDCKLQPAYTIKSIKWVYCGCEVYRKLLDFMIHTESMELGHGDQFHLTQFCQWLPTCQLKTLSRSCIEPLNIEILSRALNAVLSLKTLNMKFSKFTLQSMRAFASMLQQNQSLINVDISLCNIDSDSACCLVKALYSNTALTVLDMSKNSVGERGALAIAEMLKYNTTLTVLDMSKNSVGEKGALAMAEMLKYNTTLTVLDMSNNSVGEKGALAMAEMLKCNTTLTVLDMSKNSVGERGGLAMAEMLKHNTTLEELGMSDATIGAEGATALVESLAVNNHLKVLHILEAYKKEVEVLPAYHANEEHVTFSDPLSIIFMPDC